MKILKPKFWDKRLSFFPVLLMPLSVIFRFFVFLKRNFSKVLKFDLHIICIGNIYVGGTGKTPLSILISQELQKIGKNPVIVKKFYKDHFDEHKLIKKYFKNLYLHKNRSFAINEAKINGFQTVILDDGFQEYRIKTDLNILCFNSNQLIGNGYTFPSGPLRESINSVRYAKIVVINGEKKEVFEKKLLQINKNLNIFYSNYEPINIDEFRNKDVFALAGIGNPDNFFELLTKKNVNVIKKLIYPDHYMLSKEELLNIIKESKLKNCTVVMTEKDYFRIKDYNLENIYYLKLELKINEKAKFINQILKIYD